MTLRGPAKIARLLSIFVVATLLVVVSFIRIFNVNHDYGNNMMASGMVILIVLLVCCVMEMCWRPFNQTSDDFDSSAQDAFDATPNTNSMDIPLVYSEAPPSYDEVVTSSQHEAELPGVSSAGVIGGGVGATTVTTDVGLARTTSSPNFGLELFDDLTDGKSSSRSPSDITTNARVETNDDDFEEVYVHKRFSPFFSEGSPIPSSYASSSELKLAVNCLPTYEEAVTVLQQQQQLQRQQPDGRRSRGSRTSQDSNLILFI